MFNTVKHSIDAAKTPVGTVLATTATQVQVAWADWGSELVDALTSILGLVIAFFLVIHWYRQIFKSKDIEDK